MEKKRARILLRAAVVESSGDKRQQWGIYTE
jgi:hypothetical protein